MLSYHDRVTLKTAGSALIAGLFMLSCSLASFVLSAVDLVRFISIRSRGVRTRGLVKELIYDEKENLACDMGSTK